MFYSHSILAKSGPFAHVWLAATWEKKLTRSMIFNTDIATAVGAWPPRLPRAAPLLRPRARAPAPDRPPPRPRRIDREPVGAARAPAVGEPARRRRAHLRAQGASPASASITAPPPPSPRRPPPPAPRAVARARSAEPAEPQVAYLMNDCNEAMVKIRMAFRGGVVDLPEENAVASTAAITARRGVEGGRGSAFSRAPLS